MLNPFYEKKLLVKLCRMGLLSQDHIDLICTRSIENNESILKSIQILRFVPEDHLYQALSDVIDYPYVVLNEHQYNDLLPLDFYIRNQCVLFVEQKQSVLAMVDPLNISVKDLVRKNIEISRIYLVSPNNLSHYLQVKAKFSYDQGLYTDIFAQAILKNASDIHFQPEENYISICFRIDGILRKFKMLLKSNWPRLLVQLKLVAGMDIAESRRPQSGRFFYVIAGKEIDFRLSTHPTVNGENIVIRLLEKNKIAMPLKELGFEIDQIELLNNVINKSSGIVIISGPTGSGKTTTLYSLFSLINNGRKNILTLEEPVEYKLEGIRQTEIIDDYILSYAEGVKSILRQDPDIIFIGEIRDEITAKMSIRASITGHLVFATLHTFDSVSVLDRLIDLGIDRRFLASNLLCIVAQRLIRRICESCEGLGCKSCFNEGLKDRMVLAEILNLDDDIRHQICEGINYIDFRNLVKQKMKVFYDVALQKIQKKETKLSEINRVISI